MNHFLNLSDIPSEEVTRILEAAHKFKGDRRERRFKGSLDASPLLSGASLAMIFEQPSTRTHVSFHVAITQMGGTPIIINKESSQLGRGEEVSDTAQVLSRYVDAIMMRTQAHERIVSLAENATVPVINGLTDLHHPCQIIGDLLTIQERFPHLDTLKLAWIGDYNNVCNSFVEAANIFGFSFVIAHPPSYGPHPDALNIINNSAKITLTHTVQEAAEDADVLITDTWSSMSDTSSTQKHQDLKPFQVNDSVMGHAADHAIFLHCLPAYRELEVSSSVIDGSQSAVWDEAENRIYAQKAILAWSLGVL